MNKPVDLDFNNDGKPDISVRFHWKNILIAILSCFRCCK